VQYQKTDNVYFCEAFRSANFTIGLTNVSPVVTAPTMGDYAVCDQYPGAVGLGVTITLQCTCGLPAHRYVIVQFPIYHVAHFCELDVYIRRTYVYFTIMLLLLLLLCLIIKLFNNKVELS